MKQQLRNLALGAAMLAAAPAAMAQCSAGSTLIVGPSDQYAFQWCNGTSVTSIGLNFASSVNEYQFKKLDGSNLMTLNPTGGNYVRMGSPDAGNFAAVSGDGDLTFAGNGDYLVGNNRYAFRSVSDQDNGLFFNVSSNQYEFRDGGALAGLAIKANNSGTDEAGDLIGSGSATFEDEIVATGTIDQGAVKGISVNGPTNGYLGVQGSTDFDGIVGLNTSGQEIGVLGVSTGASAIENSGLYGYSNGNGVYAENTAGPIARLATATLAGAFDGDVDVSGNLSVGSLTQPTLEGLVSINGTASNSGNNIGILRVGSPTGSSLGFDNNEVQAYSRIFGTDTDTATGTLFLNFFGGSINAISTLSNPNGSFDIGSGKLNVSNLNDRVTMGGSNLVVDNVADEVSIGTTSASGKLHIEQSANTEALFINITGSPTESIDINRTVDMIAGQDIIDITVPSTSSATAQIMEVFGVGGLIYQLNADGHAGFGTAASSLYAIQACGDIRAEGVVVETGWCDYVFDESYELAPLSEVEAFIADNKHLPGIPSAAEVEGEGLNLGEMSANFMQKIEELTLYTIDQEKEIDALKAELDELKALLTATAK
jgi:hypothetical protein